MNNQLKGLLLGTILVEGQLLEALVGHDPVNKVPLFGPVWRQDDVNHNVPQNLRRCAQNEREGGELCQA